MSKNLKRILLIATAILVVLILIALRNNAHLRFLIGWSVDALPESSNLILVLVGIVMSFPNFAESIESRPLTRYLLATLCFVIGIVGFIVSINQKRQTTSDLHGLLNNTGKLLTNTNTLATTVGSLALQIINVRSYISDLETRRDAALNAGNSRLAVDLHGQITEALQQQADLSKTLALSMAPGIVSEMKAVSKWYYDARDMEMDLARRQRMRLGTPPTEEQLNEESELRQQLEKKDADYKVYCSPLI